VRDGLAERAERLGERLQSGLRALDWRGHLVDVRGMGLLVGLELDEAEFTRRIAEAGRLLGVVVHDHVIVGRQGHASLKAKGLI